jgi:hypothetical protein
MNKRNKLKQLKNYMGKNKYELSTLDSIPNSWVSCVRHLPEEGERSWLFSYRGVKVILYDAGNTWYGFYKPARGKLL